MLAGMLYKDSPKNHKWQLLCWPLCSYLINHVYIGWIKTADFILAIFILPITIYTISSSGNSCSIHVIHTYIHKYQVIIRSIHYMG